MKVSTVWTNGEPHGAHSVTFRFELDDDDKTESTSLNLGGGPKVQLRARSATFHFPVVIAPPHPDLMAMAALKIVSPFIGRRFEMDRPVSPDLGAMIRDAYPWITDVVVDEDLAPRSAPADTPAISFSGGSDSVAVACLMPETTPLILASRVPHPEVDVTDPTYNPDGPLGTIDAMPTDARKFIVYTDFPYVSMTGNVCVYPDTYAFTTPAILLADHLGLSHILTGDILGGLTANETKFLGAVSLARHAPFFKAGGLTLEAPCKGVSEIVTSRITEHFNLGEIATTCERGHFRQPCMTCPKCLRKSLIRWALFGQSLTAREIDAFNASDPIQAIAGRTDRRGFFLMPTFGFAFERIGARFPRSVGEIRYRALSRTSSLSWVEKYYPPAYTSVPAFLQPAFENLKEFADPMSAAEIATFERLDWETDFPHRKLALRSAVRRALQRLKARLRRAGR